MGFTKPSIGNQYLKNHVDLLLSSFKHWTGRDILEERESLEQQARELFYAPFAVASHDTSEDPILTYGNQTALTLPEKLAARGLFFHQTPPDHLGSLTFSAEVERPSKFVSLFGTWFRLHRRRQR